MILDKSTPAVSRLFAFDLDLCRRMTRLQRSASALAFFRLVSRLGDGPFWFALAAGLALFGGTASLVAVLRMSLVGIAAALVSRWLKGWANRARPFSADPGISAGGQALDPWSFPSGHTLHACAFHGVLVVDPPWLALALVPWTVAIALSRVVLGLHYPSDVAAGAAIGTALAALVLAVV